jgi:GNAT superfamily N-acetyltransferase
MLNIRPATPADVPTMLRFIHELAIYEREPDAVIATEADLLRDGFALAPDGVTRLDSPIRFRALIAELAEEELSTASSLPDSALSEGAGGFSPLNSQAEKGGFSPGTRPAGFALYFTSYSTWLGHHGIRLEDLYVTPSLRQQGIGKALLARLAQIAINEGCPRLEWDVLNWNEPAIAVYQRLGAKMQTEWRIMRLAGEPLHALAAHAS